MSASHLSLRKPAPDNGNRLEEIVESFEVAWGSGRRPSIDEYLSSGDVARHALIWELVHADLEFRLKAGEPARAEEYFERYGELASDPEQALNLIASECRLRHRREPELSVEEYLRRFPQHADELRRRLPDERPSQRRVFPAHCPYCHHPLAAESTAGESVTCPSCGSSFRWDPAESATGWPHRPSRLGRFELLEEVGRGAFGTVYRARDTELDRCVAVKVPRGSRWDSPADLERFLREARSAAQLSHSGIVPVYEVGHTLRTPYLVSAFVEGQTLAETLARRRLGFREAAEIVAEVAEALDHAHSRGIVHRDLKPSNIMLGRLASGPDTETRRSGDKETEPSVSLSSCLPISLSSDHGSRAFITDFGLAWCGEAEVTVTLEGQVVGTPAYASPEQARGASHRVDGRSDVYSLGVILYELLTGELPFRGAARMILHQILHEEPRPPRKLNDKVPRDLETIVLKCLAKEPGRRYATAADLAADLRRHLTGVPILARPVGRLERGWRWARRNPGLASLGAAVAGLLAAVVIGSLTAAILISREKDAAVAARIQEEEARRDAEYHAGIAQQQRERAEGQTRIAQEERKEAEKQARIAQQERAKAEDHAKRARRSADLSFKTLNSLVYEVQEQLKDRPAMYPLRDGLLGTAITGLEEVAETDKGVAPLHSIASAHQLRGDIYFALGRTDDARRQYERFRTLAEEMARADPRNPGVVQDLGHAHARLGDVSLRRGDADAARKSYQKALALARDVAKANQKSKPARRDVALFEISLGDASLRLGEAAQAREHYVHALDTLQGIVKSDGEDQRARQDLASACEKVGGVATQLGDLPAALKHYRRAVDLWGELATADRQSIRARRGLALTSIQLADVLLDLREPRKAQPHGKKALELCEELAAAEPSAQARRDLSCSREKVADICLRLGQLEAAREHYARCLKEREELAEADPDSAQAQNDLALAHENLGHLSKVLRQTEEARQHYREALSRREKLAEAAPGNVQAQTDLAASCGNLGIAELNAHDYAAAGRLFERGLTTMRRLEAAGKLKGQPREQQWLHHLNLLLNRTRACQRAIDDLDFALAQPAEQRPLLLHVRAIELACKGRHADALATVDRLAALAPHNPAHLYNVACCCSLCATGCGEGKPLDRLTAEEAAARKRYLTRAGEALAEAVQRGFRDLAHLEGNPDLAALRSEAAYGKAVEQLKKPGPRP